MYELAARGVLLGVARRAAVLVGPAHRSLREGARQTLLQRLAAFDGQHDLVEGWARGFTKQKKKQNQEQISSRIRRRIVPTRARERTRTRTIELQTRRFAGVARRGVTALPAETRTNDVSDIVRVREGQALLHVVQQ